MRIAINGFGRIGRLVARALIEGGYKNIELVAINDIAAPEITAHLFRYDSIHGQFDGEVEYQAPFLHINKHKIKMLKEKDPEHLPWAALKVDMVLECSGAFTDFDLARFHISAGASKVLVSAPCRNAEQTIVYGVNHKHLDSKNHIVSNASCTTNCLAPIAHVLHKNFTIVSGHMTTVHAYTSDQRIHDLPHKDLRRARAAALSMIPTSTGAAKSLGLVIPDLQGKIAGTAIRVPVPNVSLIDLVINTQKDVTKEKINDAIFSASKTKEFKGIIEYVDEPLVSTDFNHGPASAYFDALETEVMGKNFCRILAWYDNEWGFAHRMVDVCEYWGNL